MSVGDLCDLRVKGPIAWGVGRKPAAENPFHVPSIGSPGKLIGNGPEHRDAFFGLQNPVLSWFNNFYQSGLETNVAFAPPAAPQIGCLWRKRNRTQSECPTTSRHSVIPGRNNRRTWCRDQVNRASRLDGFGKESSSESDWSANATRTQGHAGRLSRRP